MGATISVNKNKRRFANSRKKVLVAVEDSDSLESLMQRLCVCVWGGSGEGIQIINNIHIIDTNQPYVGMRDPEKVF